MSRRQPDPVRDVYLHGSLGELYGHHHRLACRDAARAVRLMELRAKGFQETLAAGNWIVLAGGLDDGPVYALSAETIRGFALGADPLHFVPELEGSSSMGGTIKAVLGVALVGAAIFASGGTLAGLATPIAGSFTAGNLAMVGLAVGIAGVASLLASDEKSKKENSYDISAPNTYAEGSAVPLVYGDCFTGSVVVSVGYSTEPIPVDWDPTSGATIFNTYDPETGQGVTTGTPSQGTSSSVETLNQGTT